MLEEEPTEAGGDSPEQTDPEPAAEGPGHGDATAPDDVNVATGIPTGDAARGRLVAALLREPEVGAVAAPAGLAAAGGPGAAAGRPAAAPARLESSPAGPRGNGRSRRIASAAVACALVASAAGAAFVATHQSASGSAARASDPAGASAASESSSAYDIAVGTRHAGSPAPSPAESVSTSARPSGAVGSPGLFADGGVIIMSDDFKGSKMPWPTGSASSLTDLSYAGNRYLIFASGASTDHLIAAPAHGSTPELGVTVTASQMSGRGTAGFGVTCQAASANSASGTAAASAGPSGSAAYSTGTTYEFVVLNNGDWLVERRDGSPSFTSPPTVLFHGTSETVPGTASISISGICATAADGKSTRLALFVDGVRLTDFADASAPGQWRGGIVVTTVDVAASVSVSYFEERDLR